MCRPPTNASRRSGGSKGRPRTGSDSEDSDGAGDGEDDETQFMATK